MLLLSTAVVVVEVVVVAAVVVVVVVDVVVCVCSADTLSVCPSELTSAGTGWYDRVS